MFSVQARIEIRRKGELKTHTFRINDDDYVMRGEVAPDMDMPRYEVQHVAVDTLNGAVIAPPTSDADQAAQLVARLNLATMEE